MMDTQTQKKENIEKKMMNGDPVMAGYLCYLLDSNKVVETNDPGKIDYELKICTETEFGFYEPIRVILYG